MFFQILLYHCASNASLTQSHSIQRLNLIGPANGIFIYFPYSTAYWQNAKRTASKTVIAHVPSFFMISQCIQELRF